MCVLSNSELKTSDTPLGILCTNMYCWFNLAHLFRIKNSMNFYFLDFHYKKGELCGLWDSEIMSLTTNFLMKVESESHSVVSHCLQPYGLYSPWNSPGQNTGAGSLSLLQGIIPTQRSNSGLPLCRWSLYQLSHQGNTCSLMSPIISLIL